MALDENDRDYINRLVERVSEAFSEAIAEELVPINKKLATLPAILEVQTKILDAQEKLRTEMPRAVANVVQPKIDDLAERVRKLEAIVLAGNGAKK